MDKPKVADVKPKAVNLEAEEYYWCACGLSQNQPFCDGSHAGTDFVPKPFTPDETGEAYLCMCKHTANPPFCDGSHASLPPDDSAQRETSSEQADKSDTSDEMPQPRNTAEEPTVEWIHKLAEEGLSKTGHHGEMDAMGVPRQDLPQWNDIQVLTAQLATRPLFEDQDVGTDLVIGPKANKPLRLKIPLFVSDMSFGALSEEAKISLARGAELAETGICSGEGGMLPEEQAENSRYFYELASAKFGFEEKLLERVQAFHFKGGQGAKTGTGGHLPGNKVKGKIAQVRQLDEGAAAISPPTFADLKTVNDFKSFADRVREVSGGIPVGFKLSAQHIEKDIDFALEAGADYIILDGRGGGTGAVTHDLSVGRNVNGVLRTLNALNAGGLCPSNWKRADGVLDVASILKPGRVLGNYRIERELGQGGFGRVLEAVDLRLQRKVALKIISDQSARAEENLLKEARLAAGINHPNVCTIYSADSIDTLPVIAMEYVEGGTLADAINNGINNQEFKRFGNEIASGLAAAHREHIVHGDLKPANILIDTRDKPVIADFGLARALGQREVPTSQTVERFSDSDSPTASSVPPDSLTMEETMVYETGAGNSEGMVAETGGNHFITGTPAFMSPEQACGEPLDEFSDIFSLGLILAQMLSGQSLFGDLPPVEIVKSLRDREFVKSLSDKLPESNRNEIADMLSTDPKDRPTADQISLRFE